MESRQAHDKTNKKPEKQIINMEKKRAIQPDNAYLFLLLSCIDILRNEISRYLSPKDQVRLSKTCAKLFTIFQPKYDDIAHIELMQSGIDGNKEAVMRILKKKSFLLLKEPKQNLFIESQLTWQIFHIDKNIIQFMYERRQFKMVNLMCSYLKNSKTEVEMQWENPEVSDQKIKEYTKYLESLMNLIMKENFRNGYKDDRLIDRISEETRAGLEAFRKKLRPNTPVTLNNSVDIELFLKAAYKLANEHFNVFYDCDQRDLFCIAVIGFTQSLVSPELAQILCHGIVPYTMVKNGEISDLASQFLLVDGSPFYLSSRNASSGPGFDNMCGAHGSQARPWRSKLMPTLGNWASQGDIALEELHRMQAFEREEAKSNSKSSKQKCTIQ